MKRKILYIVGAIALVLIVLLGYYAISPLFINIELDEESPDSKARVESDEAVESAERVSPEVSEAPPPPREEQEEAPVVKSASVIGTAGHPASGTARVVSTEGKDYIRYENFKTINGPDIYVYLSNDLDANDFVSLGKVKATEGNINYEVPPGVDAGDYRYALTWCKRFGVLFNYADLSVL